MARDDAPTPDETVDATPPDPHNPFRRIWWLPVLRGTAFIVLGLLLMIEPLEELEILRLLIGIFLAFDGVLVLVQWVAHRRQVGSAWWLAQAGVNIGFGAAVALWPDLTPTPLYYVLAVWAIVLGVVAIIGGAALTRNRDLGWPWMVAFGITATLFGLLLVTRPLDSLDVLRLVAIVFALFAFVAGALDIVSGFAVRSVARELSSLREQAERVGVTVTGGSVLGSANPQVTPARASGPPSAGALTDGGGSGTSPASEPEDHSASPEDDSASPVARPATPGADAITSGGSAADDSRTPPSADEHGPHDATADGTEERADGTATPERSPRRWRGDRS
ncbi:HdeD family acid-resistance protein [Isoptericola sp. 178]|uniref:HdeD family acid-resistance protein n=1 Tax=Isoptericola sp. 178 TaxID=3064651 RepID=UPI00271246C9|nr:DUF308 domain-containing protein [Isoptericola sp. 178]MDO8144598.1 DUF308 domain-containing protein [Isoptericola sp. 178]